MPADAGRAVYWYTRSAEQGNADAQCKLGECCRFGRGLARDARQAAVLWRRAASGGSARAAEYLRLYGDPQNP